MEASVILAGKTLSMMPGRKGTEVIAHCIVRVHTPLSTRPGVPIISLMNGAVENMSDSPAYSPRHRTLLNLSHENSVEPVSGLTLLSGPISKPPPLGKVHFWIHGHLGS